MARRGASRSIAAGSVRRQIGNGEVYLVGDAAAQVKGSTVGEFVTGFPRRARRLAGALQNGKSPSFGPWRP